MRRNIGRVQSQLKIYAPSASKSLAILLVFVSVASLPAQSANANDQHDSWIHNITYDLGAGGTLALGSTSRDLNAGFNFVTGLGYRVNPGLILPLDLLVSGHGLPASILQQEHQPNGTTSLFIIAFDPSYTFSQQNHWGGYLTGGGGISIKQVVFTHPSPVDSYSYGYNAEAASESSVQPAVDFGAGVTYRIHPDSNFQLFQEARYLDMFTPKGQFPGFNQAGTNLFLLTFGLRL
ncbi:MAG TPA: hypothetical protein VFN53_02460 [Acidobacteriaceae bacterium]|nr:hypothetical protein [Acidobacteriaceae bacterium]